MADNVLNLSLPSDLMGGSSGAGVNLTYNFGPNVDALTQSAFSFLGQQAAGAQAFQANSIRGTQDFLSAAALPIVNAVAGEADSYYSQILSAFTQTTNAQQSVAMRGLDVQQQVSNASIKSSSKSRKGGSILGSIFGGGCFITTACCKYTGAPDNCETLLTMRAWRDSWMQETQARAWMVQRYYEVAPIYVQRIEALSEGMQHVIWDELRRLIEHCAFCVKHQQMQLALAYYLAAVEFARVASETQA